MEAGLGDSERKKGQRLYGGNYPKMSVEKNAGEKYAVAEQGHRTQVFLRPGALKFEIFISLLFIYLFYPF